MSNLNQIKKINYDDLEYRITPVQQAAASCSGAIITSLFGKLIYLFCKVKISQTFLFSYSSGCSENSAAGTTERD